MLPLGALRAPSAGQSLAPADPGHPDRTGPTGPPARPRRPSVLLVDDTVEFRREVRELLEHDGLAVFEAPDGLTALAILPAVAPDAVLIDLFLPGRDGLNTARLIKRAAPATQVLLHTGVDPAQAASAARADLNSAVRVGRDRVDQEPPP